MQLVRTKNKIRIRVIKCCLAITLFTTSISQAQTRFEENSFSPVIDSLFKTNLSFFQNYITFKNFYRIQIIYTEINRDQEQVPSFKHHAWRLKSDEYFNPASFVKVTAAILALDKLNNQLSNYGITKYCPLIFEKNFDCQESEIKDSTCICYYPNIAHYIKRAFVVSENSPYKRLYEFLGQEYIQNKLVEMKFDGSKIVQRFASECDEEGNRYTNAVNFFDFDSTLLYRQPEQYNSNYIRTPDSTFMVGNYVMDGNKKIKGGKDFSNANRLLLQHIHLCMMMIFFPEQMPPELKMNLSVDDLNLLRKYLGINPEESEDPKYNMDDYWPAYNNYFFYGQSKNADMLKHVRIFNKVAMAFGFLSETAYVVDFRNKREFLLSATIYVNKDGVLLDNKYDYGDVGMPFLKELSLLIYKHELKRKVVHEPKLDNLQALFK